MDMFKHEPTSVGFQASATPASSTTSSGRPTSRTGRTSQMSGSRASLTMPMPGDITCGGLLLGLAASLLVSTTRIPNDMTQAIDFAIQKIHPNVLQYTTDSARCSSSCDPGVVDAVGFWNSLARLEFLNGQTKTGVHGRQVGSVPGQWLHVDSEGRATSGPGPDLHRLAPAATTSSSRPRAGVSSKAPGLSSRRDPGRVVRRSRARLVQGRLLHLLSDHRAARPTTRRSTGTTTPPRRASGWTTTPRASGVGTTRGASHCARMLRSR